MAVRILHAPTHGQAVLYCSTTGWAFGPVFEAEDDEPYRSANHMAEAFVTWLGPARDPRQLSPSELEVMYTEWIKAGAP